MPRDTDNMGGLGVDSGGWSSSPHGNPHGVGLGAPSNAAGFGLGSPMGGSFGEPGGSGYAAEAGRAQSLGLGPAGGYDRGLLDNRDQRDLLSGVTRDDHRAIRDATRTARQVAPMGWRDHMHNFLDIVNTAVKGLGVATAGPLGVAVGAGTVGRGVLSEARDRQRMRSDLGLPAPEMPDLGAADREGRGGGEGPGKMPDQKQILQALDTAWDQAMAGARKNALEMGLKELTGGRNVV